MDQAPPNNYYQPQPPANGPAQPVNQTVFTPSTSLKKSPVKTIVLSGIAILVLGGLILGFGEARSFLSRAEGSCIPSSVEETNLTANSIEITFSTEKVCLTEMSYGTSPESMLLRVPESTAALNHRFKLSPLLPSTTYYYQVVADGKKTGSARSFLTQRTGVPENIASRPTSVPASLPTAIPSGSAAYKLDDFVKQYGTANSTFDIDKNGVVNSADWLLYQKDQP